MAASIYDENEKKKILIEKLTDELPVLRARLGASQADIADKVGISRQTYNSIETRKRKMNWTTFAALIAVFQNNEKTRQMLKKIDEFDGEISKMMAIQNENER